MAYARTDFDGRAETEPRIRRIGITDLNEAVKRGIDDLIAMPTFAAFVVVIYPVIGLLLMGLTFGYELLPLMFPVIAGFPLIAPFAAIGLYELSRRREHNLPISWDMLQDFSAHRLASLITLGLVLVAIFAAWIAAATLLYSAVFGTWTPDSIGAFVHAVLNTEPGWILIAAGCGIGLLFAAMAFSVSVVSFPLLLDRDVGVLTAIRTSMRAVAANPTVMTAWALFIALALALASLPFFIGLIVVLPVLGHATWHLYRRVVEPVD